MKCIWDLDQWKHNNINSSKIKFSQKSLYFKFEQEVQGPQAFAFSVVTVNYEHTKPRFKRKRRVKFKVGIPAELCLKVWFKSDWYFCNIIKSGWF